MALEMGMNPDETEWETVITPEAMQETVDQVMRDLDNHPVPEPLWPQRQ